MTKSFEMFEEIAEEKDERMKFHEQFVENMKSGDHDNDNFDGLVTG